MGPPFEVIFLFCAIITTAMAIPAGRLPPKTHTPANSGYKAEHCLDMTPEREEEVNSLVLRLSEFLYNLTLEYDNLDLRLVKLVVESHSENELEEKETQVELVVNDCAYIEDVIDQDDEVVALLKEDTEVDSDGSVHKKMESTQINYKDGQEVSSKTTEESGSETKQTFSKSEQSKENSKESYKSTSESSSNVQSDIKEEEELRKSEAKKTFSKSEVSSSEESSKTTSEFSNNVENNVVVCEDSNDEYEAEKSGSLYWFRLDVDENGSRVLKQTEARRGKGPLLLYLKRGVFHDQYWFLN